MTFPIFASAPLNLRAERTQQIATTTTTHIKYTQRGAAQWHYLLIQQI
jgi:hypothetical protein